ncbi:SGNH/GDSL hydrolase family protein [Alicyclobacillus acidiphilus]|uniref:SGNH/GDSL hydrolase family protein n=1 Tax=Alicyclobacillus acidiphilus TaxID=182455 RepID=UPI000835A6EA|nr:SGNH/GDSL hydrolase family protein [Alicyclobacillus acidiphilus]
MKRTVWGILSAVIAAGIALSYPLSYTHSHGDTISPAMSLSQSVPQTLSKVRVMAIGGSIALGWDDNKQDGGYLTRTFRALSNAKTTYQFTNEASEGKGPSYYLLRMNTLLTKDKPNLVVISFGLLNDLYDKHPISQLDAQIVDETKDALHAGAQVAIVTPPVVGASYVEFKTEQPIALRSEEKAVEALHNPNVHIVDLFSQMKAYLADHDLTWETYAADGWHPNEAGHELAATLLEADLRKDSWLNKTPIPS